MRHNKKKNTGLLYEFLVRHVSKCVIEKRNDEAAKAVSLIKRYFKSGPLKEELDLFNHVFASRCLTSEYAARVLKEVLTAARSLDSTKLDEAKAELAQDIAKAFRTESFYNANVPNYVMLASLQTLLNNESGKKKLRESIDKIHLEEKIVAGMLTPREKKQTIAEQMKLNPQANNVVYKLVTKKFETKYASNLSEDQKRLLRKYARSLISENTGELEHAVKHQLERVRAALDFVGDKEIAADKDLMEKIVESRKKLTSIDPKCMSDESLTSMLRFMTLADEVTA